MRKYAIPVSSFLGFIIAVSLWFHFNSSGAVARPAKPQAPRTPLEQLTIDVYKKANEAVVFISTITLTVDPFDFVDGIKPREGSGTGVIVDANKGIILTNLHVIQDAHKIEILHANGSKYKARLLGHDREYDIAVLQLIEPPANLVSLDFADSSRLEVGQNVMAIGNPHGLNRTLTSGIISSLNRTVRNPNGYLMKDLVQTDAAINPGNSGGPLLDTSGRMIGMNTAIVSRSGDSAGIGFAVPANQIGRILPELISTGRVLRPKLGWILVDTSQGVMVRRVFKGGPAALVGISPIEKEVESVFLKGYVRDFQRADLVFKVNGVRVFTREDVDSQVSKLKKGQSVTLTLRRGGASGAEREVVLAPILG